MITALDAVLDAFRPPDRERNRDKRSAPLTRRVTAIVMACAKARQYTRWRKGMVTQTWRGPRAATVTVFVKTNGPLQPVFAEFTGHSSIYNVQFVMTRNPLS